MPGNSDVVLSASRVSCDWRDVAQRTVKFMLMALGDDTVTVTPGSDSVLCPDGSTAGPGQICPATGVAFVNPTLPLCSSLTLPPGFVGPMNCDPSSGPPTYTVTVGSSQSSNSNTCASFGLSLNPSTGLCVGSAASVPSSSAGSGLTSAQQAQLSAGLLKGGLTLAELLAIQPGQAILPNGTIVSGNTGALTAGSLASLGASMTSMLPLLLIGGIALMLFTRK